METSYIQRGKGKLDVGEFGKEAKRLVDQIDRQFGKGLGMWSGLIPRGVGDTFPNSSLKLAQDYPTSSSL